MKSTVKFFAIIGAIIGTVSGMFVDGGSLDQVIGSGLAGILFGSLIGAFIWGGTWTCSPTPATSTASRSTS